MKDIDMRFLKFMAVGAALTVFAAPAMAATLTLEAKAKFAWQSSDFSIVFDDKDGDGVLSFDEIISFSGFTSNQFDTYYPKVLRVPAIAGFTDELPVTTSSGFTFNSWLFADGTAQRTTAQPTSFEYSISVVPLPASGLMLLAGLAGLAAARRRKTR